MKKSDNYSTLIPVKNVCKQRQVKISVRQMYFWLTGNLSAYAEKLRSQHIPMLLQDVNTATAHTSIIDFLCYLLVILGIVGNVSGLFIFALSRRSWRVSSTYTCLATSSSVANLLCVIRYSAILCSKSRRILQSVVGHQWWACKLYEFTFGFRVISAWITLFWLCERVTCVSSRWKALLSPFNTSPVKFIVPLGMMFVILCCVIGPSVYLFQPNVPMHKSFGSATNTMTCDLPANASARWQSFFHDLQPGFNHFTIRCIFSELIPTPIVLLLNGIVVHQLFRKFRSLARQNLHPSHAGHCHMRSWMNAVLILHSLLFFASIMSHLAGHLRHLVAHETWWVVLSVLMNSSLNFYVYCLSGRAFRNEIARLIRRCCKRWCCRRQVYYHRSPAKLKHAFEMNKFRMKMPVTKR